LAFKAKPFIELDLFFEQFHLLLQTVDILFMLIPRTLSSLSILLLLNFGPFLLTQLDLRFLRNLFLFFWLFPLVAALI
jgi:hypothetical protein